MRDFLSPCLKHHLFATAFSLETEPCLLSEHYAKKHSTNGEAKRQIRTEPRRERNLTIERAAASSTLTIVLG